MYPKARLQCTVDSMDALPQLSVRLRDDAHVWGTCTAGPGSTLQLSKSFLVVEEVTLFTFLGYDKPYTLNPKL